MNSIPIPEFLKTYDCLMQNRPTVEVLEISSGVPKTVAVIFYSVDVKGKTELKVAMAGRTDKSTSLTGDELAKVQWLITKSDQKLLETLVYIFDAITYSIIGKSYRAYSNFTKE